MIPKVVVNIGIDSQATITKGEAINNHVDGRNQTRLREDDGTLLLGGEVSPFHRETP